MTRLARTHPFSTHRIQFHPLSASVRRGLIPREMTFPASIGNPWIFTLGLLGNIVSFMVFLAPVPTFFRVCRKRSTEGFHSIPYVVALFSAMLWIYYASLKPCDFLLISVNSVGCVAEAVYIVLFIAWAPKQARVSTTRLLILLNFGGFCGIIPLSHLLPNASTRVQVVGGICVAVSVSVFAAPLSIMRTVIRTKRVEFMPFPLSFLLTLSAVIWLLYGISSKDLYVAVITSSPCFTLLVSVGRMHDILSFFSQSSAGDQTQLPNALGVVLGVLQMTLYMVYRKSKMDIEEQLPTAAGPGNNRACIPPDIERGGCELPHTFPATQTKSAATS